MVERGSASDRKMNTKDVAICRIERSSHELYKQKQTHREHELASYQGRKVTERDSWEVWDGHVHSALLGPDHHDLLYRHTGNSASIFYNNPLGIISYLNVW